MKQLSFFLICPLLSIVPGYPGYVLLGRASWPILVPSSWFLITRRTVSIDRLILYPKAEPQHGHPRYLNSLPSIGSSAVLEFPGRSSKTRGRPEIPTIFPSLSFSLYLLVSVKTVTHRFYPEIRHDSRNHPLRMITLQFDDPMAST